MARPARRYSSQRLSPVLPIAGIRCHEIGTRRHLRGLFDRQASHEAVIDFHPVGIELQRHAERLADNFRRLAGAQQRTGNALIEGNPLDAANAWPVPGPGRGLSRSAGNRHDPGSGLRHCRPICRDAGR